MATRGKSGFTVSGPKPGTSTPFELTDRRARQATRSRSISELSGRSTYPADTGAVTAPGVTHLPGVW